MDKVNHTIESSDTWYNISEDYTVIINIVVGNDVHYITEDKVDRYQMDMDAFRDEFVSIT